ncbi:50S ribosomal protein L23 [Salinivirga cyanobacteriivorans]|uniref:Large ribosomal subunit protein uL23 n=1 Tax=Salinivirga cyanobacteriivorans TaxID=1307839 RepID=A0A0S2I2K1_9BACT|nr:50S ribosomal protein L23 [Salinivirga cyanobacteriivorans]ALO16664.1 50S ribosomal protein L23 [Salinivirga cyanobacteriivorans]
MEILKKPIITEKMTAKSEDLNQYGFIVDKEATKEQIKDAVEELYQVKVDSVNTMRYGGRQQMRYTKAGVVAGRKPAFKKAIVTLQDGETIDFYSNI